MDIYLSDTDEMEFLSDSDEEQDLFINRRVDPILPPFREVQTVQQNQGQGIPFLNNVHSNAAGVIDSVVTTEPTPTQPPESSHNSNLETSSAMEGVHQEPSANNQPSSEEPTDSNPPMEVAPPITPRKTIAKPSGSLKKAFPRQSPLKEGGEDDGQTCSICFEAWSISGDHRLASLKCGHIFGKSCVEKWLKTLGSQSKCPQCNARAHKKDIRVLYVKTLKALDTSEKDRLSNELNQVKADKMALEREHSQVLIKCELNSQYVKKLQEELRLLKASITKSACDPVDSLALVNPYNVSSTSSSSKNFKIVHFNTLSVSKDGDCRVMAVNEWMHMLIVSVPSQVTMFPGYGIKKINLLEMKSERYLPLHQKQIRDLSFNPHKQNLLLSVSIDKVAKITNIESNSTVASYEASAPLWCCCWNTDRTNEFYVGTSTGKVLHFDTTNIDGPIHTYDIVGSGPIVSISYIPRHEGNLFYKTGILVTRLQSIFFVDLHEDSFKEYNLPIEGTFTHVTYDSILNHFLVTARPSVRFPHARHSLHQLICVNISDSPTDINYAVSSNEIHSFQGGTSITVLSRADKILRSPSGKESVLICEESSQSSKLYSISTATLSQRINLRDTVLDSIAIHVGAKSYLAFLTSKSVIFYQWIQDLSA